MSNLFIPLIVLFVIIYGFFKKINIYDAFIEGVIDSFSMIMKMFPSLLAMILAVNIFKSSKIIDYVFSFLKPLFLLLKIPFEVLPIAVMRPLSGSFGLALLNNIYGIYGPDSYISFLSSVIQGSSDTTIYIITLYFGTVGIKKIKHALWVGLLADLFMVIMSLIIVPFLF
ncbi:MAG: spore maturation protein [Bacilli bacterium]|nr:spore maturation protein [Bacilli bacterium]